MLAEASRPGVDSVSGATGFGPLGGVGRFLADLGALVAVRLFSTRLALSALPGGLGGLFPRALGGGGRRGLERFEVNQWYLHLEDAGLHDGQVLVGLDADERGPLVERHDVDLLARFEKGELVNRKTLLAKRLVDRGDMPVKLLGDGDVTVAYQISVDAVSAPARAKIEAAGGTVTLPEVKIRRARGVAKTHAPTGPRPTSLTGPRPVKPRTPGRKPPKARG